MSPDNPTVLATYTKLRTADPLVRISQFIDASLSRVTIPVYIEIGEAGKSYLEASLQLGIVGSAGLSRLEQLRRTFAPKWGDGPMMLPALGWTVIGHDWKLHIICKLTENEQDAVVSQKSFHSLLPCSLYLLLISGFRMSMDLTIVAEQKITFKSLPYSV
jgi:hypothetical protein